MGMYIRQENSRTKLQERVAAELAEKAKQKTPAAGDRPDGVDDSEFLKQTKTTTSLAWVWVLILIAAVGILIWLVVISR